MMMIKALKPIQTALLEGSHTSHKQSVPYIYTIKSALYNYISNSALYNCTIK